MIKDILEDSSGDIQLINGDIRLGASLFQHQANIIVAGKGEYRRAINSTVGAIDYIDDEDPEEFLQDIRLKLVKDGQTVDSISIDNGQVICKADYE